MPLVTENSIEHIVANPTHLHQSFHINEDLIFINFVDLDEWEALEVLAWRNHPKIRRVMFTQQLITDEEHLNFIADLTKQQQRFYWVVKEGNQSLGVIDIVDFKGLECEWGFYLNPNYFGKGLAVNLIFHALNFFFKELKLEKLYGYCHYKNTKGLLFHDLFNINHVHYKKCFLADREAWHSRREILRKNWINSEFNISDIKAQLKQRINVITLEHRKIQFDQLFLETYKNPPYLYYQTNSNSIRLTDQMDKFQALLARIEMTFGKKISKLQATDISYYMDALKFCI